ncbi:HpcH/HpaI aldolase/citrate lyase family protein [Anatilimnocola sp. NA78]|uniref:HpcH/HpaI aldolase family protein n=1 Tax=Anatilimnocola sp. NA78 TaxID=3415683 RepID=UPI003CE48AE2
MKSFKTLLAEGTLCRIFCSGRIIHPVVFDVVGMLGGFHGFWIDQEHAAVSYEQIVLASACGRANGLDNFVRMPMSNYAMATANLEAGAGGLMAARIESAKHAEEFMQWAKFQPRGIRGLNTSGYDADYGGKTLPQLAHDANRDSFVAIQIETLGALEECEAIAALDGVDLLFVGPSDLSQELGILAQWDNEKLWNAYAKVAAACKKHGKNWGTIAVNPGFAKRTYDMGCRMLSFGIDAVILRRGVEATRTAFGELFQ